MFFIPGINVILHILIGSPPLSGRGPLTSGRNLTICHSLSTKETSSVHESRVGAGVTVTLLGQKTEGPEGTRDSAPALTPEEGTTRTPRQAVSVDRRTILVGRQGRDPKVGFEKRRLSEPKGWTRHPHTTRV